MRTNYVLIDYENVQPCIVPALKQMGCKVVVFVGAHQTKMPFELVAGLQEMGGDASYIKLTGSGPNALDLHIAFYIGQISQQDPNSFFHIISKDAGFDPLVGHLKGKNIFAARSCSIAEMPLLKTSDCSTVADKHAAVISRVRGMGAAKPGSVKTLISTIRALFHQKLSEAEVAKLVEDLTTAGFIKIDGTRIVYSLPDAPASGS